MSSELAPSSVSYIWAEMPRGWERDKGKTIAHGYNVRLPAFGFHVHVSLRSAILMMVNNSPRLSRFDKYCLGWLFTQLSAVYKCVHVSEQTVAGSHYKSILAAVNSCLLV